MQSTGEWIRRLSLMAGVLLAVSCGDDGSAPAVTPQTIAISGGDGQTGTVGQVAGTALSILVTGSDSQPFEGATVTWQVTAGGGSVLPATSVTGAQGTATTQWTLGTAAGAQTVTATVQGLAPATFTATAAAGAPSQIVITPASPTIDALEGTVQLEAALQDQYGNAVAGGTFAWSSADESIVIVDAASGLATARAAGTARITVTADGTALSASTDVTVSQVAASLELGPPDPQLAIGTTLQMTASVKDGNDFDIPSADVTWASADEAIATIDASGLVTGVAEGTARIRATSGAAADSIDVIVILDAPDFAPDTDTEIGGTMTVGALTIPAGVTVTVTSDLVINALEDITVEGTLAGDCVAISVTGRGAATYAGGVSNACSVEGDEDLPDVVLVNDGPLTIDGGVFTYAGDLDIRNDPTVGDDDFDSASSRSSRRGFRVDAAASEQVGGPCINHGGQFSPSAPTARPGADGTGTGGDGRGAGNVTLTCRGDLVMQGDDGEPGSVEGRDGGAGGDATNADPATDDASGRGGNGGNGGDVNVRATGDISFEATGGGTVLRLTNGGDGGDATVLGRDPGGNATATGGNGGDGGNMLVDAGGSISVSPGGLTIVVGRGGHGGEAIANAGNGKDADETAATSGGSATATGGNGGHSVEGRLRARGSVNGGGNIALSGGDGGAGGPASAVAGRGGHGNLEFPDGANGGSMSATGGNGGEARTRDITGTTVGTSANGGDILVSNGRGGNGADRCSIPDSGGKGGNGGSADGRPGDRGEGENPGEPGSITVAAATGNGGDGDDGNPGGAAGTAGADNLAAGFDRTDEGPVFQDGTPGNPCPIAFQIDWQTTSDPNGHTPFIGLIEVPGINVTFDGMGGITITGPAPWVALTGTIDEDGDFVTSGTGNLAGFSGVVVTFNGRIEDGQISGELTADAENNRFPAGGDGERHPAVYQVTGQS